jgi:succinylarginine dihydrolase
LVADPATVDPRFLLDDAKADAIECVIAAEWPESIDPAEIGTDALRARVVSARLSLLQTLSLQELG